MNRKLYEFNVPYNFPTTFYECNGEIINICDPNKPEPAEVSVFWQPRAGFCRSRVSNTKIFVPTIRMKRKHVEMYLRIQIPALVKWANKQLMEGNVFIIKKDAGSEELLIGMFIRNAVGGILMGDKV